MVCMRMCVSCVCVCVCVCVVSCVCVCVVCLRLCVFVCVCVRASVRVLCRVVCACVLCRVSACVIARVRVRQASTGAVRLLSSVRTRDRRVCALLPTRYGDAAPPNFALKMAGPGVGSGVRAGGGVQEPGPALSQHRLDLAIPATGRSRPAGTCSRTRPPSHTHIHTL